MMSSFHEKIKLVHQALLRHHLNAYVFLTGDPHASEYVCDHFATRSYFSGFFGSAGTLVVTTDKVLLWTDSRYYLEAAALCEAQGMQLMRDGLPQTPSIVEYLTENLSNGARIGVDGHTIPIQTASNWQQTLKQRANIELILTFDLFEEIATHRPTLPKQSISHLPDDVTGASAKAKISAIAKDLIKLGYDHYLAVPLDSVAYLTNLRGSDVHFNPLFYGFLWIRQDATATLFCAKESLSAEARQYLADNDILIEDYESIAQVLLNIEPAFLYTSAKHINATLHRALSGLHHVILGEDWGQNLKLRKNSTERKFLEAQYINDGVAYVHFLKRFSQQEFQSEYEVVQGLYQERAKRLDFCGESFPSIVGSASNGAIVHYRPTQEKHAKLSNGFVVIDSGAHYLGATTDITRTPYIGTPTEQAKKDYTLVLKAHIAFARTPFPRYATGAQIDGITRACLWQAGLNFGHGTGHGVGAMLSVHEEPFRVNKLNTVLIDEGMTISNEPGLYRDGEYGIRLENIYIASESHSNSFDDFLCWQVLTLAPFHTQAIDKSLLDAADIAWLNAYHQQVFDKLAPHLDAEHQQFLKQMTQPI